MYNKIHALCEENGIKTAELCRKAGIPKSTLTELKQGRTKSLSTATLRKIAAYFTVSLDYFESPNEKSEPENSLEAKRELLFELSKKATEEQLDIFLVMIKALVCDKQ